MNHQLFSRFCGVLLVGVLAASPARAQQPGYSVVATPWMGSDAAAPGTTRVHALAYLRNTEYFNPVEEGQTWFGTQLAVQRAWAVSPQVTFRAGAWMNHTYGGTTRLLPLVQMRYETAPSVSAARWQWLAGTLDGAASHGLLEPLYDASRALEDPLEYGLQSTKRNGRWRSDQWISWQKAIVYAEPAFERIWAGTTQHLDVWNRGDQRVSLLAQALWSHAGGQIDASPVGTPEGNRFNGALGLSATGGLVEAQAARLFYTDPLARFSPIEQGGGLLLHVHAQPRLNAHHRLRLGATYWNASDFVAPGGGYLFQSVNRYDPTVYQKERRLLIGRLGWDRLQSAHHLSVRVDPVLDLQSKTLEWAFSFYWQMHLTP